jgi:hypothetical protein
MFLIILFLIIIYLFYNKTKYESFSIISEDVIHSSIINNLNNSDELKDRDIPISDVLDLFKITYSSKNHNEAATIIFNDQNLFKRFFILKDNELKNNIDIINNILQQHKNYEIIKKDFNNSHFWNTSLINENSLKMYINKFLRNTPFLNTDIKKRNFFMQDDSLRLLFKSIIEDLGPFVLNS